MPNLKEGLQKADREEKSRQENPNARNRPKKKHSGTDAKTATGPTEYQPNYDTAKCIYVAT